MVKQKPGAKPTENDAQIVFRVPRALAERLKQYADELSHSVGVPVSVAAAVRKLLEAGLETERRRK